METNNHSEIRQRFVDVTDLELLILIQNTRSEDAIVEFGIRIRPVVLKILYRDYCADLKGVSKESLVAEVIADLLLDPPKLREGPRAASTQSCIFVYASATNCFRLEEPSSTLGATTNRFVR